MIKINFFLGMLVFGWIVSQPTNGLGNAEIVSESSPLYNELMPVAIKWKDAILNKNIKVLVDYGFPEGRKKIAGDLRNKNSDLHRIFFTDKNSFYEIFRKAKRLRILLVNHVPEEFGLGTSAYYYDEGRIKLKSPLNMEEVQRLYDAGEIATVTFSKAEGQWFASYEFFH